MALLFNYDGQIVIIVNVYAPIHKPDLEKFLLDLRFISIASDHHLYVDGDFSCTLHNAHDRAC